MNTICRPGLVVLVAALATAPAAMGQVPLTGGKIAKLIDRDGTSADKAVVKFVRDPSLSPPLPDPSSTTSSIALRSEDGDTGTIPLDPAKWTAAGNDGWVYRDKAGGAIQNVVFKGRGADGRLLIKAGGDAYGAVALPGPESRIDVILTIGSVEYCGRFEEPPSVARKNLPGTVLYKGPSAACDGGTCVDLDGDGWGRDGFNSSCVGNEDVDDCNDEPGNVVDEDGDNVCDDGGVEFCATGQSVGCNDNCPDDANNDVGDVQTDSDRDGKGDVCDQACPYGPTVYEICGDCLDNDCDGWVDEVECGYGRTMVVVTDSEPIAPGYPMSFRFDHANLVAGGYSTLSGDDVRILYKDPDLPCDDLNALACYREIDRVLDPTSSFGQSGPTTLWFVAQDPIAAQSLNANYEVYFGVSDVGVPADESAVFHMADFFDRAVTPTNDVTGWAEDEEVDTDWSINASQLVMGVSDNDSYDPGITRPFSAIGDGSPYGIYELRIGMDWIRTTEPDWNVGIQLGNSAAMQPILLDPDYPNEGVGPSMGWGGGTIFGGLAATTFATENGGALTAHGTFNSANDISVTIDFDGDVTPRYSVTGVGISATHVGFTTAQPSLDTLRLFGDEIGPGFSSQAWDYVMMRPVVASGSEPVVILGKQEPEGDSFACTLQTPATVRYFLADGEGNPGELTIVDAMGNHPMTVVRASDSPDWGDYLQLGQFGLHYFGDEGGDGRAATDVITSGSPLGQLDFTTAMTFEVVTTNDDTDADGTRYAMSLDNENNAHVVSLGFSDGETVVAEIRVGTHTDGGVVQTSFWEWSVPFSYAGRVVLHLVIDTALASDRVKLYHNGAALPLASSTGALSQNTGIHLIDTGAGEDSALLSIGNDKNLGSSMVGRLSYGAIYPGALDETTIEQHASDLLRHDD